jgi:hypothetical protein
MKTPSSAPPAPRTEKEVLQELAALQARAQPLSEVRQDLVRLDRELKAARATTKT